jgi:hypothetical protein
MIVDQPVHRLVSEVVVPGVLKHYDVGDLLSAIAPRQVTIITPQNAMGETISDAEFQKLWPMAKVRFAKGLSDVF